MWSSVMGVKSTLAARRFDLRRQDLPQYRIISDPLEELTTRTALLKKLKEMYICEKLW